MRFLHERTAAALTFPEENLSVGTIVQDETVTGHQNILRERVLLRYHRDLHVPSSIGHLGGRRPASFSQEARGERPAHLVGGGLTL